MTDYRLLALDNDTPQGRVPQSGDTGVVDNLYPAEKTYLDSDRDSYTESTTDDEWAWTFGGTLALTWTLAKAQFIESWSQKKFPDTTGDHFYNFGVSELAADRTVTLPLLAASDTFVFENHSQTLTNKTLTTPKVNDASADHTYNFAVSELTASRTITLPLLTGNDEFVFKDHTQTLTNKTLTSPTINTPTVSGGSINNTPIGQTTPAAVGATAYDISGTEVIDASRNATFNQVTTDTIAEETAAAGVTVDGAQLKDGNFVPGAGNGVDFSANGGGVFNHYEEGTFTPVLSDGTNDATASAATGRYTKIGDRVFYTLRIATSSLGSVSGNLRITGLPFTPTSSNVFGGFAVGRPRNLNITAGQSVGGYVQNGQAYLVLELWDDATGATNMQETEWSADGELTISGQYEAA